MSFNMDVVGGTVGSLCEAYRDVTRSSPVGHHVNLLFDHQTDAIGIRSPYTHDRLEVVLKVEGPLFVRIPTWLDRDSLKIEGANHDPVPANGFLLFARQPVGVPIRFDFSLRSRQLILAADLHVQPIRVELLGDSVTAMEDFGTDLTFFDPLADHGG